MVIPLIQSFGHFEVCVFNANCHNLSPYLTGVQQLETSSRLFRDYFANSFNATFFHVAVSLQTFMRHFREFLSNFANISHDCQETLLRQSRDIGESHDIHMNDIRMSLSLFSRQIVASCSHVFPRLLCVCYKTFIRVLRQCSIVNSQNFAATG